jgi:hypothetical protein
MRLTPIAMGALLTGCVNPFAQFYSEAPQYKGQNIDALVDRIGYPDSQTFVTGRIVYSWLPKSTVQQDSGSMQAPPAGAPDSPLPLATRSGSQTENLHFRCTLQVETDGSGTILHLSWEGKNGSCGP